VTDVEVGAAPVHRLADRVAVVFVPVVMVLAMAAWGFWTARTGSLSDAVEPAIAVLIIACPCALGLATPTALLVGTGRGAQLGILIKGPAVLESTPRIDTIALDTTEGGSEHPIGAAIVRHAVGLGIDIPAATAHSTTPGLDTDLARLRDDGDTVRQVGIATGTGTGIAREASDLTLVRADLAAADAIRLSRRTLAVIKTNLFWAFAYNVAAIPLAMAWLLSPVIAVAAMAFSSLLVVSNSLRLRTFDARRVHAAAVRP